MKKIVLASGSPRRRELLSQIGLEFEVMTSNAPEYTDETEPGRIVEALSLLKAESVKNLKSCDELKDCIIIGADTIVYNNGYILGKPSDIQKASMMIKDISGHEHSVYTGVTVLNGNEKIMFHEKTVVSVYEMTEEEIKNYVSDGKCLDKAGAYGIQGGFAAFVKEIRGDYNNVVGLPVARLYHELKLKGWL